MAGEQPLESKSSAPGAFPETPANEEQAFSVNPIPASQGIGNPIQLTPGDKVPESAGINKSTVESGVHDDPELKAKDEGEQTLGVAPIPATGGIGNPIQLAPGEKVPDASTITSNTVDSTAKMDESSYQKSDAAVTSTAPDAGTAQKDITPSQAILSGPGPVIPESSMPMGNTTDASTADVGPTISSVGATSTTNELAGQVPKESRGVPTVVSESQQEANVAPEASANPEAVSEKKEVEEELQKKVTEEPSTSESGVLGKSEDGIGAKIAAGAAAGGVAAAGAAVAANEFIKEKTGKDAKAALPESVQQTVDDKAKDSAIPQQAAASTTDAARETTNTVPEEVSASQKEAGQEPEASASPDAVKEKAAVEDELLKKVPESEAQGEPAPTASAAATETAPAATSASGAPQLGDPVAGVEPISMDSRDVSPTSKPAGEPQATTGVASAAIPRNNGPSASTPQKRQSFVDKLKGTPESSKTSETTDSKKEKRRSLFGRIKDKLKQ